MEIGLELRRLRETKNLSQGDIEKRSGLLRGNTSRVENGYTVPSVETLEKYARALAVPLYGLFTDDKGAKVTEVPRGQGRKAWGAKPEDSAEWRAFAKALARLDDRKRKLILAMAQNLAGRVDFTGSIRDPAGSFLPGLRGAVLPGTLMQGNSPHI
jgi:transcriptional regulator with XRE-family HTH domain